MITRNCRCTSSLYTKINRKRMGNIGVANHIDIIAQCIIERVRKLNSNVDIHSINNNGIKIASASSRTRYIIPMSILIVSVISRLRLTS